MVACINERDRMNGNRNYVAIKMVNDPRQSDPTDLDLWLWRGGPPRGPAAAAAAALQSVGTCFEPSLAPAGA